MPETEQTPARSRSLRRLALRLAVALFASAFALLAGEAALRGYLYYKGIGRGDLGALLKRSEQSGTRQLHGGTGLFGLVRPSKHPDVVYELRPGQSGVFAGGEVRTNSHGMRSAEVTREKPPGTFRIVGIGDSHMFGWGVNQDETYLAVLERKLNAAAPAGRRFEVLNFGAPGYNTAMEVAVFEHRALEFDPDLVILHFIGNDMQDPHFVETVRTWDPRDWYLLELARILTDRGESEEEREEARSRRYRGGNYKHLSGTARFRQAMERLRDVAAAHRIPVVYLVYGRTGKHRAFVLSFGAELGFQVLEATPYFDAYLIARGHTPSHQIAKKVFDGRDAHPSKQGHEAYAEALFARLSEMGLVGAPASAQPGPAN